MSRAPRRTAGGGRAGRLWATLTLTLASAVGLWAFLAPLAADTRPAAAGTTAEGAGAAGAPLVFFLLVGLCLAALVGDLETRRMDTRTVAVLGVLLGVNAVLRLVPGPLGFSATFFLPIVCGYVLGADFGFLLGALTLLVSAFLTDGLGPWLPFQMFAAGWIGLVAGWLPDLQRRPRLEVVQLAAWGLASGFFFGAAMNLWFWPYLELGTAAGPSWQAGAGLAANLAAYAVYYVTASLWWDIGRAVGNVVLLAAAGPPVLRLLRRFRRRFRFEHLDAAPGR